MSYVMNIRLPLLALVLGFATLLSAQTATETRSLTAFDQVAISGGFDQVTLQAGAEEKVVLEVVGVDLDKVVTEVKDKTLSIHMKKGSYNNVKIRLTVTYRQLDEISNSGSSDIAVTSPITGEKFAYYSSGSGDFSATLDVRQFKVNLSGSSDVKVSGQADTQTIAISGSGDIQAGELKGQSASVAISGSGDVKLNVSGPVKTAISGSGNVDNKGK